ncbi:MAG: rhomboid family intramembrane serine protease [Deinococcales bacterium]
MTESALFLLLVTIAGVYAVRWAGRLAPLSSEFPAKTLIATALSALIAVTGFTSLRVSAVLRDLALVVGPVYVFGPLVLVSLARNRRYRFAGVLSDALYWTAEGRAAVRRLLAQAALQQGDAESALKLSPRHDSLLLIQAHVLQEDWDAILHLEDVPREGDNAFLAAGARIQALLALGHPDQARQELATMKRRWEGGARGPIGYRSVVISEARCDAEDGDFEKVRDGLQQPLSGVHPSTLYAILARAAERGGQRDAAVTLYTHAFQSAPGALQPRYAAKLRELGQVPPPLARRSARPVATLSLAGAIVAAYVAEILVNRFIGAVRVGAQTLHLSSFTAAFMLNIPGVPGEHAWWRLLTYAFLHANLVHIGFNTWVLVDLGRIYEQRRGWGNVIAAFVVGTAAGAYLTSVAQAQQPLLLIGASGGILGIAGALLADVLRSPVASDRLLLRGLVQWMILIALFSVAVPNVSLWGHAGGVVGGLLWGFVRQGLPADRRIGSVAGVLGIVLLVAALASAVITSVSALH